MQRYLLHVSYIGTQFRGAQKTINLSEPNKCDRTTIQGLLEIALHKLKPINQIRVVPSSRTDTGVHALHSTFQVDLQRHGNNPYDTINITSILNKYFTYENYLINVIDTQKVPNTFHCRFCAKSRTYLYRVAILKSNYFNSNNKYIYPIPIEEYYRCCFVCHPKFNFEKMEEASYLFSGLHDFRTFMGRGSHFLNKMTRRNMEINIMDGITSASLEKTNAKEMYKYLNISCKSSGFLYNQVRRIVGTLIAVGQEKLTLKEVKSMLEVPSHLSWNPRVSLAPSYGLYLCQVEYSPNDLEIIEEPANKEIVTGKV